MMMASDLIDVRDREIIGTRVFDAPCALVWRAFTDPDHLKHWWGPNGFTNTFHEFDFRPGGAWRFIMHGPDGTDYKNDNLFVEIVFLERIVFDHVSYPKHRATILFEDVGGETKLIFRMVFESSDDFESVKPYAVPGLEQNLEKLALHLPTIDPLRRELTIKRTFDAPRDVVWKAWTDSKQLAVWWGPHGFTNPVCEIDVRPGGAIYIVMRAPDGTDYPMRGVFREVVSPERLVFINFPVDDMDNPLIDGLTTVMLTERGRKTEMILHTRGIGLVPHAEFMITGMGEGWSQSIDRLAELVGSARRLK
jgi:uncharacterized protein YndB with AHSA1/START domain